MLQCKRSHRPRRARAGQQRRDRVAGHRARLTKARHVSRTRSKPLEEGSGFHSTRLQLQLQLALLQAYSAGSDREVHPGAGSLVQNTEGPLVCEIAGLCQHTGLMVSCVHPVVLRGAIDCFNIRVQ